MSDPPGRARERRVLLPLLATAEPQSRAARAALPAIAPGQRPMAQRAWLAVIGAPEDEAPAYFACALVSALGPGECTALLTDAAPAALATALQRSGASVLRAAPAASDAPALQARLAELPARALVLVLESELACQLRGVLDVWVGALPGHGSDPQLNALQRAADLIVPAHAGEALARELARQLARRASSR